MCSRAVFVFLGPQSVVCIYHVPFVSSNLEQFLSLLCLSQLVFEESASCFDPRVGNYESPSGLSLENYALYEKDAPTCDHVLSCGPKV